MSKAAGRCPLGARYQAFIYRKQFWIMSCNAAVVRVNSLEARDQSKQDWAPDQSCWQTQQHCCFATVCLSFSSLSAEAQAIFSTGSSFPNASTTTHLSPLNSSLHIAPTSAFILTIQLHAMYSLNDLLWSLHSARLLPSSLLISPAVLGRKRGSAGKLRRCVRWGWGADCAPRLSSSHSHFPKTQAASRLVRPCLVALGVSIILCFFG